MQLTAKRLTPEKLTPEKLTPEKLTPTGFAPFGHVIAPNTCKRQFPINDGITERFHDLTPLDCALDGGSVGVSLFRSNPIELPYELVRMERHPLGSQSFMPLSGEPFLVVVAPTNASDTPDWPNMRAFIADEGQGVTYNRGTWHHYCLALNKLSDFLVIDRISPPGEDELANLDEVDFPHPVTVSL